MLKIPFLDHLNSLIETTVNWICFIRKNSNIKVENKKNDFDGKNVGENVALIFSNVHRNKMAYVAMHSVADRIPLNTINLTVAGLQLKIKMQTKNFN